MLTDTAIRAAKPRQKPYKLHDSGGLYVYVSTTGARSWRYDYRLAGQRKTFTVGLYPTVDLKKARRRHHEARDMVERGESPSLAKKRARQAAVLKAGNTVSAMAESWFEENAPTKSASWRASQRRWIDKHIKPAFGSRPVADVEPADVLALIKTIARAHPKTAEHVRQTCARIFQYAIRTLRAKQNPAREVAGAIVIPPTVHHKALPAKQIPTFLETLDRDTGRLSTKLAIKALLLTVVRKNELAAAKQDEFDLVEALWTIPAERMKMKRTHLVPLSKQAVATFRELFALAGTSRYVLPHMGDVSKHMNEATFNFAFWRMKIENVPHSLRGTFSTWANERGFNPDAIERQLAHVERNKIRGSYNAAEYLPERRALMQAWADACEGQADNVVNIGKRRA